MPAPRSALPTSVRAQKCGMAMSVTTQIFFPYMSDARTPAMDVQMAAQDACTPDLFKIFILTPGRHTRRSFHVFLSAMLIADDGYCTAASSFVGWVHSADESEQGRNARRRLPAIRPFATKLTVIDHVRPGRQHVLSRTRRSRGHTQLRLLEHSHVTSLASSSGHPPGAVPRDPQPGGVE